MLKINTQKHIPLYLSAISAGFASSAEDYIDKSIDLNEELVKHPAATFFVRVKGYSMIGCGIAEGDILIVDRSLDPQNNSIIIAYLDGEFTVKRVRKDNHGFYLIPENKNFKPIKVSDKSDFEVWGSVTYVIKKIR